jgi:hypothetical protein
VQQAHAVRPDQHAGPDLAEFWCLLVDRGLNASPGQRGGGRQPADSAAYYRRRQALTHQHDGIISHEGIKKNPQ